jgi:hypothetical protein
MIHSRISWFLLLACAIVITGAVVSEVVDVASTPTANLPPAPALFRKRLRLVDIGAVVARKIHGASIGRSESNAVELVDGPEWAPRDESGETVWTMFRRIMHNRLFLVGFSGFVGLIGTGILFFGLSLRSPARRRRLVRQIFGLAGLEGRPPLARPSDRHQNIYDERTGNGAGPLSEYALTRNGLTPSRRGSAWRDQVSMSGRKDDLAVRFRHMQDSLAGKEEYV